MLISIFGWSSVLHLNIAQRYEKVSLVKQRASRKRGGHFQRQARPLWSMVN